MKLLVLHSELGVLRGGGETFSRNLFSAFVERGHHVTAAFIADPDSRYPMPMPSCIEPMPIPGWWSRKLGQPTLSSIGGYIPATANLRIKWDRAQEALCWRSIRWHNRRFQRRVENLFRHRWNDFDAIYVQSNVELAGRIASHHPTLLMLPGPVGAELAPVLRSVQAVCAHDDALRLMRGILGEKVLDLPLGLDTDLFSPGASAVRAALGWNEDLVVVGYVGRLTQLKGVDLLTSAFKQLARTVPEIRLLVVGSGEEERNIRSTLGNEIKQALVHIEPAIDQVHLPEWYRAMDLLVMPSRYETMSNAILEALACKTPFVASEVGGNLTIGQTGAGWLFESESVSSLCASLRTALRNRDEIKGRGTLGRQVVQEKYSWTNSAKILEDIISSCLGVKR